MATYTYNPTISTDRDRLRLRLSDTRAPYYFADEELDGLLTDEGSLDGATVAAARVWLANLGRHGGTYSNDRGSVSDAGRRESLEALIRHYGGIGDRLPSVSGPFPALRPFDSGYQET